MDNSDRVGAHHQRCRRQRDRRRQPHYGGDDAHGEEHGGGIDQYDPPLDAGSARYQRRRLAATESDEHHRAQRDRGRRTPSCRSRRRKLHPAPAPQTPGQDQSTQSAVEQSRQTATVTVAELLETHGMLRSDTTTMFERLREANGLLQDVLSGAQDNLSSIEHMLSSRVTEFVATMNQLLERTGTATVKMDDHIGSFYGVDHARRWAGPHRAGRRSSMPTAARSRRRSSWSSCSNRRADDVLGARRYRARHGRPATSRAAPTISTSGSVGSPGPARRVARRRQRLAPATSPAWSRTASAEGTRAIAEQHEAVRMTSEQERVRTADALRTLYEQATNEAHMLFRENASDAQNMLQESRDRFAEIVLPGRASMMAARDAARGRCDAWRATPRHPRVAAGDRRRAPSQMRRVIVDQIEALAELNRIVAHHGRGMDAPAGRAGPPRAARESVVVSMGGGRGASGRARRPAWMRLRAGTDADAGPADAVRAAARRGAVPQPGTEPRCAQRSCRRGIRARHRLQ